MITIPEITKKYGSDLTLMKREGSVVLFKLTRGHRNKVRGYEIMIVQVRPAGTVFGKWNPGGEFLPSSSEWGRVGWSFTAKEEERALEVFARKCKMYNVRKLVRRKA